jgi:hypothetical protein
MAQGSPTEEQ